MVLHGGCSRPRRSNEEIQEGHHWATGARSIRVALGTSASVLVILLVLPDAIREDEQRNQSGLQTGWVVRGTVRKGSAVKGGGIRVDAVKCMEGNQGWA